jgi:hypothetical protein
MFAWWPPFWPVQIIGSAALLVKKVIAMLRELGISAQKSPIPLTLRCPMTKGADEPPRFTTLCV